MKEGGYVFIIRSLSRLTRFGCVVSIAESLTEELVQTRLARM